MAIPRQLGSMGYDIVGLDVVEPATPDNSSAPLFTDFVSVDFADRDAAAKAVARVVEAEPPAILVHCASSTRGAKFIDIDPATDDRVIIINLTGTLNALRPVLQGMC